MDNPQDQQARRKPEIVLIVDDEAPIADALAMIIEDAGLSPLTASHGQEALALARANWPALVITDMMMPRLSGKDLIAALRQDATQRGIPPPPMVLVTAGGMHEAREAGADIILRKPFTLAQVEAALLRFLGPPIPRDS